tara:strand:+ start:231 stop:413 length:183 start_codon:yes stop_codon:yes gene_type:complete
MHPARLLLKAANVKIVELVGIDQFQMYVMASTKKIRGNELTLAGVVKEDLTRSSSSPLNN